MSIWEPDSGIVALSNGLVANQLVFAMNMVG